MLLRKYLFNAIVQHVFTKEKSFEGRISKMVN